MDLKYFTIERTENGCGAMGAVLPNRVFSITKEGGNVIFKEECDGYFYETFTKKQAIEVLNEAIEYIKENF